MSKIINFKEHFKTEPGRCKDASETIRETIQKTFTDMNWKKQREIEEENAATFRKKYKAVYAFMPQNVKSKIPYLAQTMLCLIPVMFQYQNSTERLQAFFDYGDFLYKEMKPAMLELEKEYKKYRKIIPFYKFEVVEENGLEDALRQCLKNIIFLAGKGKEEEEELLTELYRLFNLDVFLNRMMAH